MTNQNKKKAFLQQISALWDLTDGNVSIDIRSLKFAKTQKILDDSKKYGLKPHHYPLKRLIELYIREKKYPCHVDVCSANQFKSLPEFEEFTSRTIGKVLKHLCYHEVGQIRNELGMKHRCYLIRDWGLDYSLVDAKQFRDEFDGKNIDKKEEKFKISVDNLLKRN